MNSPMTLHFVGGPKDGEVLAWTHDVREFQFPVLREMGGLVLSPKPGDSSLPVEHVVYRSHDHPLMHHNELAKAFRSRSRVFRRPDSPAARRATREGRPRPEEVDIKPHLHNGVCGHRTLFFVG